MPPEPFNPLVESSNLSGPTKKLRPATANVSTVVRDCPLQLAPAFHRSTRPGTATAEPQTIGFRHPATESPFVGVIV